MFVYLLTDEASYYSGLKVDGLGILHIVNPAIGHTRWYRCALAAHMPSMVPIHPTVPSSVGATCFGNTEGLSSPMPVQLAGHYKPLVLSCSQRVFRDSILLFPQVLNMSATAGETQKKANHCLCND